MPNERTVLFLPIGRFTWVVNLILTVVIIAPSLYTERNVQFLQCKSGKAEYECLMEVCVCVVCVCVVCVCVCVCVWMFCVN